MSPFCGDTSRGGPNRQGRELRYGWLYYRRVKTKKQFYRPLNRVAQAHLKSILPAHPEPDQPVFDCGSSRPNVQFQRLCRLAGVKPKQDVETGEEKLWDEVIRSTDLLVYPSGSAEPVYGRGSCTPSVP